MRNRWNDFRCLYLANLEEDQTHEVDYKSCTDLKNPASPEFSVTISIEGLRCQIASHVREANPVASKLFDGSTATLCIATKGAEFAPRKDDERMLQFNPKSKPVASTYK